MGSKREELEGTPKSWSRRRQWESIGDQCQMSGGKSQLAWETMSITLGSLGLGGYDMPRCWKYNPGARGELGEDGHVTGVRAVDCVWQGGKKAKGES